MTTAITVTDKAVAELDAYFVDKEKSPVRIYLAPGGCQGPRLALALDETTDDDTITEIGGLTYCINKELLDTVKSVHIDLTNMGFVAEPEVPFTRGGSCGSGCGSCCGSCGD